jgi:hypothetical protein
MDRNCFFYFIVNLILFIIFLTLNPDQSRNFIYAGF